MPCYKPMVAARMPGRTKTGKQPIKFLKRASNWSVRNDGNPVNNLLLPCRQCIGCRLERSRTWATRLMHEVPQHPGAIFLTLTYDDEHLPVDRSLNPSHISTFIKDLRQRLEYHFEEKIKYFAVGEYGDQTQRPHYHAIIYGPFNVTDPGYTGLIPEEPARSGGHQFSSPDIQAVWPFGFHRISECTFESAAYVARYCLKKISGAEQEAHYEGRHPEFQRASNGLGKGHFEKWTSDIYPSDHVVMPGRGSFMPPPYYDRLLEKVDPALYAQVKKARQEQKEDLSVSEWFDDAYTRSMECEVKTLTTKATLIRGIL